MDILGAAEDLEDVLRMFVGPGPFEVGVVEAHGRSHTALFADEFKAADGPRPDALRHV